MAKMTKDTNPIKKKNPVRQKLIVEQGRAMFEPKVPFKVLYTEIVPSKEDAEIRLKELKEEYKDTDAVSINYFSL